MHRLTLLPPAGGYAADVVPLILGSLPYANIHDELVASLLDVEARLY